ncbi:hypothetical protein F4808DRAFT_161086 [Astrocystis sublimbata]|nr:hypothetical protein F4808DRAFT_161086 [Astrocystis sublimbata]
MSEKDLEAYRNTILPLIKPALRGPERRADKLSFLDEVTEEQLRTYSPGQLKTIMKQREHVLEVASEQERQFAVATHGVYHPFGSGQQTSRGSTASDWTPWVRGRDASCDRMCHRCHTADSRSFLSLNGILNGDIPPTAACFYGRGKVRVVDRKIMENIGTRPVPLPRRRSLQTSTSKSTSLSYMSTSTQAEEQDEGSAGEGSSSDNNDNMAPPAAGHETKDLGEGPLEVIEGISVLEESAETGVPDLIPQE